MFPYGEVCSCDVCRGVACPEDYPEEEDTDSTFWDDLQNEIYLEGDGDYDRL